jgi:hypothetical protein
MTQEFTRIHNGTTLLLEHAESGWDFYDGIHIVKGIQEELFTAHCEKLKKSLTKDMPSLWEQWREKLLPERIFDLVAYWPWNCIFFLEDCTPFPYCEEEIPAPQLLPDGSVSMIPVHEYLQSWQAETEKRHYPLPEDQAMYWRRRKDILSKYWGFGEYDRYYRDNPYDFLTERIEKPLTEDEYSSSCFFRLGVAPNGRWGITSQLQFRLNDSVVLSKYQFPSRESAILHEIESLKEQISSDKEIRNRKDILEWLNHLKSELIQPELFSFAG